MHLKVKPGWVLTNQGLGSDEWMPSLFIHGSANGLNIDHGEDISYCGLGPDTKSFIYQNMAVKEKAWSKTCQICTTSTFCKHKLVNSRKRKRRTRPSFACPVLTPWVKCTLVDF